MRLQSTPRPVHGGETAPLGQTGASKPALAASPELYCDLPPRSSAKSGIPSAPPAMVAALFDPAPQLVVGDAPGDPDCFGAALAWTRARRALGLEAVVHVDAPPPSAIAPLFAPDELASREQVQSGKFGTVVLVDNDGTRVGPAADEALSKADKVVVLDHHDVDPTPEKLGLKKDAQLDRWIDTGNESAAVMVLGTIQKAAGDAKWSTGQWRDVLGPVVSATFSDTRGFRAARTRSSTVQALRTLIAEHKMNLSMLLSTYETASRRNLVSALEPHLGVKSEKIGGEEVRFYALSPDALGAFAEVRAQHPELKPADIGFAALDLVELNMESHGSAASVFAWGGFSADRVASLPEEERKMLPEKTRFSVRTREPDLAPAWAQRLGGGGKPREGGGRSELNADAFLAEARQAYKALAGLRSDAQIRLPGRLVRPQS